MTTDEFNTKYKLLKQIAHGKGRSFTGQECFGGRAVLVHFLPVDEPISDVSGLIERLSPRDRSRIVEVLTVNASTVVVTQFLEDFHSFDAWLHGRLADPLVPASGAPAQSVPAPGDFTSMFEPPRQAMPGRPAAEPPPAPKPHAQGSFTDLFRAAPGGKPNPAFSASPPSVPPVELRSVRLPLSDPSPSRPSPPAAPFPSALEPPRMPQLQRPALAGPIVPKPRLPSPMLPNSVLPNPVLPNPLLPAPRLNEPIVKPPLRDALPPPAPLPGWAGESDYTRQLRSIPAPADPIPAPAVLAPPPDPQGGGRSLVPLLLMLNIVVIIATGLILYFALKR